eukprot:Em0142g2a
MSTALENEDRDFVTEDDLRAGNELVWDTLKWGFSQQAQPWSKQTVDDYENMETQLTCGEENECAVLKAQSDSMTAVPSKPCVPEAGKETQESHECNATISDELRRIRIAVEAILNHLISNTVPTPNCQLTSSTTLTCDPPSTSKEAQAESQSKPINQSPEYFVNKNGVDLLKVRGTNVVKYALGLLDALYTEEELKQSSFVPVGKSTTSVKPPLSPERMKLFEGKILGMILGQGGKILDMILVMILGQGGKIMGMIFGEGGKILGMIFGQGGKIMGMILGEGGKILGMILGQGGKIMGMILGQGGKIMGMILGQGGKIMGMILGQEGKILGMIVGQGGKILDKILGMILVHGAVNTRSNMAFKTLSVLRLTFPSGTRSLIASSNRLTKMSFSSREEKDEAQ